jgi:hypothetical protein
MTLSGDASSWAGSIPTPVLRGPHVINARAIQGSITVAEASVPIEVTS